MVKMRGQSSIELIIIFAVSLIALLSIIALANNNIIGLNSQREKDDALTSVNELAQAVKDVYSQGPGAKKLVFIRIPNGIDPSKTLISNRTINFNVSGSDIFASTDVDVYGSLPTEPGGHWLWVTSAENFVRIGSTSIQLSVQSIYTQMLQSTTKTESITITNLGKSSINFSLSKDWNNTAVTLSLSDSSFILALNQSKIVDLNFTASSSAVGNYVGTLNIIGTYGSTTENLSVPLNAEVLVQGGPQSYLVVVPNYFTDTISAGSSSTKTFTVCNTSDSVMANVSFTPSAGAPGSWVESITSISPLSAQSCQSKLITVLVPAGASSGIYSGSIALSDGAGNDTSISLSITVPVSLPTTAMRWALSFCDWLNCNSTAKVISAPDNVFDESTQANNSLGGRNFDFSGLSGTINSVSLYWSHEIPLTTAQSSIIETSVADFSDGTNTNTEITNNSGGEVALKQIPRIDVITVTSGNTQLYIARRTTQAWAGQSFRPTVNNITGVSLNLRRYGRPPVLLVSLRSTLTGADIASATIDWLIPTAYTWIDANFSAPVNVTVGSTYYIVLSTGSMGSTNNYYRWNANNTNPYANGTAYQQTTQQPNTDALMRTYYRGYASSGNYVSSTLDFSSMKTIKTLEFNSTLNGQTLTLAYQLSNNAVDWNAWSAENPASPITVDWNARYLRYRASFTGSGSATAFLNDVNATALSQSGLIDDSVALTYGLTNYNDLTAKTYNNSNTPVDFMDSDPLLVEKIDVTSARPGGGSWTWADFSNLKIGGLYSIVSSLDSSWRLDAVGVEVNYAP
ncbi:MAG: hypothetical protein AB1467_05330 [Candidatus Diapherotrites archaeon]